MLSARASQSGREGMHDLVVHAAPPDARVWYAVPSTARRHLNRVDSEASGCLRRLRTTSSASIYVLRFRSGAGFARVDKVEPLVYIK